MQTFFMMFLQLIALLLIIPLFDGIARKLRARYQSRIGPPIYQTYRDFVKLYKRKRTLPEYSSPLYRYTPYLLFATVCTMFCILPVAYTNNSLVAGFSDIFIFLYLGAMARFLFASAGIDSGDAYAGIGSNRELMLGMYVEPVLILTLISVMLQANSTNIAHIKELVLNGDIGYMNPSFSIASIAFLWAMYVECGRKPYDLAEAEQELDEGLLGEYSGRDLAFMQASLIIKQFVMIGFFLILFEPWNFQNPILALIVFLAEAGALYIGAIFLDNFTPRFKIKTSIRLGAYIALGIALTSVFLYIIGV